MLNLRKGRLFSDILWSVRKARRTGGKAGIKTFQALRYLRGSDAVDSAFYQIQLSGTPLDHLDPITHYVVFGVHEGFDPSSEFSTLRYLDVHTDVQATGINPFFHYLKYGQNEHRKTTPSVKLAELAARLFDRPAPENHNLLEQHIHRWPLRDNPESKSEKNNAYDVRPDDPIIVASRQGNTFFEIHGLNMPAPRYEDAIQALNAQGFKSADDCDISIVIPIYGQLTYTLNCLDSLLSHKSRYKFEIIIADDASKDESAQWLSKLNGVRYIHFPKNEGFLINCNKAAALARGHYLVLLNNDTRVCDGWLDRLADTFIAYPDAGLAGSKLCNPDGSLQEAGGIVWRDGSAWNYGRGDDPNRPRYCYAREADYISGASIMMPADVWRQLGGFDIAYRPAYYEDTDLAFRTRAAGLQVIYQPLSRVVHYEGITSGTDTGQGVKSFQVVNGRTFFSRWRQQLAFHRANGEKPWWECERKVEKRVLIIDAVNPTPAQNAGSLATLNLIKSYQTLGYKVTFVPEDNFLYERDQVEALQAIGVECVYAPFETSLESLLGHTGILYDVVHLIRADIAYRSLNTVTRLAPRARILFLNADLHYLRLERQAAVESNPSLLEKAENYRRKEFHLAAVCDTILVHSTVEREILSEQVVGARVQILPLAETPVASISDHSGRYDIMFMGGYNHTPNVDAALWILDELWPQLSEQLPEARLLLVGSNPPEALLRRASDRIVVSGTVPDLAPWFDRARVFLAPLRYGAGAKGKIIAAMVHGVPIVATAIASEGMELKNGKTIFHADDAASLISQTVKIYQMSARKWLSLSKTIRAHATNAHSAAAATEALRMALETKSQSDVQSYAVHRTGS